ncbi:MAG TPA: Clp protease N-terminal domain-containing protein [Ktedonobacteraceae bacterium]|nr:Clp protease N-terminal domain-containing protein [Ktedonobacteraceae bacterium]
MSKAENITHTTTKTAIAFKSFTEQAKNVLAQAEEEARQLNHNYIGTEHLLLGLLNEGDNQAAKVLNDLGIDLASVRAAVEGIVGRGEEPVVGEMSLTPRTLKVIGIAGSEAHKLNAGSKVAPEHLLLGLVLEGQGMAARILETLGAPLQKIRAQTYISIISAGRAHQPPAPKSNVVTCRIDDRDLDAIDALIEAGIRNNRSDAASWLIHVGLEANKELIEKVYGTVAEIRRLRATAQTLAQEVTEGKSSTTEQNEKEAGDEK